MNNIVLGLAQGILCHARGAVLLSGLGQKRSVPRGKIAAVQASWRITAISPSS